MTLVWTGANYKYGATATSPTLDLQIDAQSLINGTVNIGPVGYRAWLRCRVEVVADANDSSEQSLHVYAKVSDYMDNGVAGGVQCYPKYYQKFSNGTAYTYGRPNENDQGTNKGGIILGGGQFYGGTSAGIAKNTNGTYPARYPEWTVYFDLGTVTPGSSVITPTYKVGFVPDVWRWSGTSQLTMTPQTVTVTYNDNAGGENVGFVQSQIRFAGWTGCGFSTVISASSYQRVGWAFTGWNTAADGSGTSYNPGDTYAGTTDLTLYAQWVRTVKTLTYAENRPQGATGTIMPGVPDAITVDADVNITIDSRNPVSSTNFTPPYTFVGWNTNASANTYQYQGGDTYSSQNSATLYAIWSTDYVRPSFLPGECKAFRSDSAGQPEATESYLTVSGTVAVNQTTIIPTNKPETMDVLDNGTSIMSFASTDFVDNGDGTWSFSQTSVNPDLNPGTTYSLTIKFMDTFMTDYPAAAGASAPLIRTGVTIPVAFITFSTNGKGKTAAFGKQALASPVNSTDGNLDIYMDAEFHGAVKGLPVDGTTIDYDGNGDLSFVGTIPTGLTCTENHGGKTWAQCCAVPSPNGVGWREEKWSDGRLTVWFWDWWQVNSASRTITWTWPTGPTAFVAAEPPFFTTRPNGTSTYVGINSTAQATNTSLTCYIYKSGANCNCPIMVRIDGHWQ